MKILHVCLASFYIDGFSYQENMLPKFHKQQGYEVEIVASLVTFDRDGNPALLAKPSTYINEHGIRVTRLQYRLGRWLRTLRFYDGLSRELDRFRPDVLFIHGVQFMDAMVIRDYARSHPHVFVYIDNHADFSNSAKSLLSHRLLHGILWKRMARMIEPYTTRFYGVLPARVTFLKEVYGIANDRVHLLVMGADDEEVEASSGPDIRSSTRLDLGLQEDDFVLVTGGKIDQAKWQVLNLMRFVQKAGDPKLKLIVFGSIVPELKEQIEELSGTDCVQYVGWAGTTESYRYFAIADLVVFPGRHSVYWEQACGMGKPMVVKRWPGTTHVDHGGNCHFLESDDMDEMVAVLRSVIYDSDVYARMLSVAGGEAMQLFSYSHIAARSLAEVKG